jgi:hypothetical protein
MMKKLLFFVSVYFLTATTTIFAQTTISSVVGSNPVVPGQDHTVTVTYTSTVDTDILLIFRQIEGNFAWIYQNQLPAPIGTDVDLVFTMGDANSFSPQPTVSSTNSHIWVATADNFGPITANSAPISIDVNALSVSPELELKNSFLMFPNPAQTELNVKIPQAGTVDIISLAGKAIYSQEFNTIGSKTLDIQNLSAGIYLVRYTNNQQIQTLKLIKQ